ncbi:MAG: tyrosine-type recombinase/integrase, partial [Gemmatimonadales bacterium]
MKGHVRKRGTTWSYVIDVGGSGPRQQKWRGGFRTRKEAEVALRQALTVIDQGGDPFPRDVLLADYLARWLEYQALRVRANTLKREAELLRLHVVPSIGKVRLDRVRPAHVQQVMDEMLGAGLAPGTVVRARSVLGKAMRRAVAWGLIPANPVHAVSPPRPERPQLAVPTPGELLELVRVVEGTVWEVPMLLAASTGARRGEVLAIRWSDVDFATGRVRITGSLQRSGGEIRRVDPKTDRARRQVTLPAFAVERLKRHRMDQATLRLALGFWHADDSVCDRGGELVDPDAFSHAFKTAAAAAGLPARMRLHDVRHGVATAWLQQGLHPAIASA